MITDPTFESVDNYTADLLDLVAEDDLSPAPISEWATFVDALERAADQAGHIDPNQVRPLIRGEVAPRRIGAFYHRAATQGLICPDGWVTSTDLQGRNAGKPSRAYRWVGGAP